MNVGYHFASSLRSAVNSGDGGSPARARRLAQEISSLASSLPLNYSSSVFVRCDEERLDIMKVRQRDWEERDRQLCWRYGAWQARKAWRLSLSWDPGSTAICVSNIKCLQVLWLDVRRNFARTQTRKNSLLTFQNTRFSDWYHHWLIDILALHSCVSYGKRKGSFTHAMFDAILRTKRALPYPARMFFSRSIAWIGKKVIRYYLSLFFPIYANLVVFCRSVTRLKTRAG